MPKTIFGTTEKSNFILNMQPLTVQKWIHGVLLFCVIFPQVGGAFISFFGKDLYDISSTGLAIDIYWLGFFLWATGFTAFLFWLIPMLRIDLKFFENPVYTVMGLIVIFTIVSYYGVIIRGWHDGFAQRSLFGDMGRYEGLLSLFAYFGIFLAATSVTQKKTIKGVFDIIIAAGILQSVVSILQHTKALNFPSYFRNIDTMAIINTMLSSGLSESPIFYGSFVTLVSGIALTGCIYEKNLVRARVYGLTAVLMLTTGLFTSSIVPIIGIGTAVVIVTVIVAVNHAKGVETRFKRGILVSPELRYAVMVGLLAGTFAIIYLAQGIYIRDRGIAYTDSIFRLGTTVSLAYAGETTTYSIYKIAWPRSVEYALEYPLTGVGPDCLALYQNTLGDMDFEKYQMNAVDRSYNEYLYIAATRGIPSLLCYLALLYFALRNGFKHMKNFFKDLDNWYVPAFITAVSAYAIAGFWGASAITVAPFFWMILGLMSAKKIEE